MNYTRSLCVCLGGHLFAVLTRVFVFRKKEAAVALRHQSRPEEDGEE